MSAQDAQDLTKRARMFVRDGKFQEAVDNLLEALEIDPEHTAAYNLLGIAQARLGKGKKALAAFRKGKTRDKENPVLHFNLAIALETEGQPGKAVPRYRAAFRLHPGWIGAMNALGLALLKQEDYAAANRAFSQVLKLDPGNAEALNNKGLVLAEQGRNKEAIKKFRAALEIDGKYVNAALNLARLLEETENFAASLEELERLADLVPENWDARTRLAALYQKLERYDEALDQVQEILEKEPDNVRALRIAGALQGIRGNDEEAKNIFERVTTLNPAVADEEEASARFVSELPESRYWLDLAPPPAAEPPADKPKSTHPGAIALAKARAAKKAAREAEEAGAALPESELPDPEPPDPAAEVLWSEPPAAAPGAGPGLLGLLRYLLDLTEALPEPVLDDFRRSDAHRDMQFIIETLENPNG
jgi:tetratricopeptide (TPR) repeat protein